MNQDKDLQSVLDEMFAAEKKFTFEITREWQRRYPQFRTEIAEAIADWREFEFLVLEDAETIEASQLSKTAQSAMEKALAQFDILSPEVITDLRELAEKQGIKRESLLEKLGVSETLMRKLERRNLNEIPQFIEKKMAEIYRVSVESLQAFFILPATLPTAARYKSKRTPQTQPKQSFVDAVKNDPELTNEEKRRLLELTKD